MVKNCQIAALTKPPSCSADSRPPPIGHRGGMPSYFLFSFVRHECFPVSSDLPQALALTCAKAAARRTGCHIPANAPNSDKTAATPIAGANPALKAWGEPKFPLPAKTATAIAIPDTPPRKRSVLKV